MIYYLMSIDNLCHSEYMVKSKKPDMDHFAYETNAIKFKVNILGQSLHVDRTKLGEFKCPHDMLDFLVSIKKEFNYEAFCSNLLNVMFLVVTHPATMLLPESDFFRSSKLIKNIIRITRTDARCNYLCF